ELRFENLRRLLVERGRITEIALGESGRGERSQHHRAGREQTRTDFHGVLTGAVNYLPANFFFNCAATEAGTKAETLPPMEAIWRTSVAVIGRVAGEDGRKTVCTSGAREPFIPAICIS